MMLTVTRQFEFAASHQLPYHEGKCRRLHGHNYRLEVAVAAESLHARGPATGMVVDFGDLKAMLKPLLDVLDHSHLNAYLPNPTAENIAAAIACYVAKRLTMQWQTVQVVVAETPTAWACAELTCEQWRAMEGSIPDDWRWRGCGADS